ncbi:MAG: hypothetical protein AB1442_11225 [Nitrospirota bacterium]
MDSAGEELRIMQMQFIGRIIASFTHEVKNHLAFIKESAGLVGDLMASREHLDVKDVHHTVDIMQSIEDQVRKSSEFCSYLNRFAHRMDCLKTTFDMNECVDDLRVLMHRIANQKRIVIGKAFESDRLQIHSSPALLQLMVFCVLEEMINRLAMNSRIGLKTLSSKEGISVVISPEGEETPQSEAERRCSIPFLQNIARRLEGAFEEKGKDVVITLPRS